AFRYYGTATEYGNAPRRASGQPLLRARFHGSSDARLSHSNYYSASICENGGKLATEPEREETPLFVKKAHAPARNDMDGISESSQLVHS
ncbi:hypothetical protein KIN20_013315, partial [Parelaphostrongylus tenuis]